MRRLFFICLCFALTGCVTPRYEVVFNGPWRISAAADPALRTGKQTLIHERPAASPLYRAFTLTVGLENHGFQPVYGTRFFLKLPQDLHVVNPPSGTVRNKDRLMLPMLTDLVPGKRSVLHLLVRPVKTGLFNYTLLMETKEKREASWYMVKMREKGQVKITRPILTSTTRFDHPDGATSTGVFSVKNSGDAAAFGVLLVWDIPPGWQFIPPVPGTVTGRSLLVNAGTIPPGGTKEVVARVSHPAPQRMAGTVAISATGVTPIRQVVKINE